MEKLPAQKLFFKWLESLGLTTPYKRKGQSSNIKDPNFILRRFSGKQCKKITKSFNKEAIPCLKEADQIVWIMNNYYRIHIGYIYNFYINKTELLQERLNEWKKKF